MSETAYPTTSASRVTSRKWTRLTGFPSTVLSTTGEEDQFGLRSNSATVVDRTKKRLWSATTYTGVSTPAYTTVNNGFAAQEIGTDSRSVTHHYDSLGRQDQSTDSRTGTTNYAYTTVSGNNTDQVYTVTDPASVVVATYTYDSAGRVIAVEDAKGNYSYTAYDYASRGTNQWGGAVTPVSYSYTSYGETYQQSTYRGGSGWTGSTWPGSPGTADTTTFTYDGPSGLLTTKTDPNGKAVTSTYNDRGLVATKTLARTAYVAEYNALGGVRLTDDIKKNITASDIFVVIWSSSAKSSEWVTQEVGIAESLNKIIVPIVLEPDLKPTGFISNRKYVSAFGDLEKAILELKSIVEDAMKKKSDETGKAILAIAAIGLLIAALSSK